MTKSILGLSSSILLLVTAAVALAAEPLTWRADDQGWEEEPAGVTDARALTAAGDFDGARAALRAAQRRGASQQLVHLQLGYVDLAEGDIDAAKGAFEACLTARGELHPAFTGLARLQLAFLGMQGTEDEAGAARVHLDEVASGDEPFLAQRAQLALSYWLVQDLEASSGLALKAAQGPDEGLRVSALAALVTTAKASGVDRCLALLEDAGDLGDEEARSQIMAALPDCARNARLPIGQEPESANEERLRDLSGDNEAALEALGELLTPWVRGLQARDAPQAEERLAGATSPVLRATLAQLYSDLAFNRMMAGDVGARDAAARVQDLDMPFGLVWSPLMRDEPVESIDPDSLDAFCLAMADNDAMGAGWCLLGWRRAIETGAVKARDRRVRAILKATERAAQRDGKVLVQRVGLQLHTQRNPTLKLLAERSEGGDAYFWMDLAYELQRSEPRLPEALAVFELVARMDTGGTAEVARKEAATLRARMDLDD